MAEFIVGQGNYYSVTEILSSGLLSSGDTIRLTKVSYESLTFDKDTFLNFGTLTIDLGNYAIWSNSRGNHSTVNIPKDIKGFTVRFKNGNLEDSWDGNVFKIGARVKNITIELEKVYLISNSRIIDPPDNPIFKIISPSPSFFLMLGVADASSTTENGYLNGIATVGVEAPPIQVYNPQRYIFDHEQNPPVITHPINDRLIDIVSYLPSNLRDTEMFSFVKLFQDFLNYELYKTAEPVGGWDIPVSVLKKIEKILDNRSPDDIDSDFLHNFLANIGYNLNYNEATYMKVFGNENFVVPFIRNLCRTLPFFYATKSTERLFKSFLCMFGVKVDFKKLYSTDYIVFDTEDGDGKMLTPHFGVTFTITHSGLVVDSTIYIIKDTVDRSKPINTVFDDYRLVLDFNGHLAQKDLSEDVDWNPKAPEGKYKYLYAIGTPTVHTGIHVVGSSQYDLSNIMWDVDEEKWVLKNVPEPVSLNSNSIIVHMGHYSNLPLG